MGHIYSGKIAVHQYNRLIIGNQFLNVLLHAWRRSDYIAIYLALRQHSNQFLTLLAVIFGACIHNLITKPGGFIFNNA